MKWNENHPLKTIKFDVFYTDLPIDNVWILTLLSGSDLETILSPNYIKFATKCHWNSKIFQKVQNLGFLGWTDWFFLEKKLEFLSK